MGQAFQPAGAGDFPVARHGTGKFREPADKNVCPTSTWLRSSQTIFGVRVNNKPLKESSAFLLRRKRAKSNTSCCNGSGKAMTSFSINSIVLMAQYRRSGALASAKVAASLNRPRMSPLAHGRELVVEAHSEVAAINRRGELRKPLTDSPTSNQGVVELRPPNRKPGARGTRPSEKQIFLDCLGSPHRRLGVRGSRTIGEPPSGGGDLSRRAGSQCSMLAVRAPRQLHICSTVSMPRIFKPCLSTRAVRSHSARRLLREGSSALSTGQVSKKRMKWLAKS